MHVSSLIIIYTIVFSMTSSNNQRSKGINTSSTIRNGIEIVMLTFHLFLSIRSFWFFLLLHIGHLHTIFFQNSCKRPLCRRTMKFPCIGHFPHFWTKPTYSLFFFFVVTFLMPRTKTTKRNHETQWSQNQLRNRRTEQRRGGYTASNERSSSS